MPLVVEMGLDGDAPVSYLAQRRLLHRYIYIVIPVVTLLILIAHSIERIPATYVDSATVVFATNTTSLALNPNSTVDGSLITTDAVVVGSLMDPQSRVLVRQAGGTADFNLSLINFDNQDFPEYSYPLAVLMTQSVDPLAAYHTFNAALKVLRQILADLQAHVSQPDRISLRVVGATGPVRQPGSLKRSLAAIGLLTLIAIGIVANFLSRNRNWLSLPLRQHRPLASKHIPRHRIVRRQGTLQALSRDQRLHGAQHTLSPQYGVREVKGHLGTAK
jgi:hypothetical protein